MKKRILSLLTAAIFLSAAAHAEVRTTGNVNLRDGAGLDYQIVASVGEGVELDFLDEVRVDARGVEWYLVDYAGEARWISSRYSELVNEALPELPAYDAKAAEAYVEVADYYMTELAAAAEALGLRDYREVASEVPHQYSDASLTLAGDDAVAYIGLKGAGYTVFGAAVGMEIEDAKVELTEAGLDFRTDTGDVVVFEHRAAEDAPINVEGYDSCINLTYENGVVAQLDWSTYSG